MPTDLVACQSSFLEIGWLTTPKNQNHIIIPLPTSEDALTAKLQLRNVVGDDKNETECRSAILVFELIHFRLEPASPFAMIIFPTSPLEPVKHEERT